MARVAEGVSCCTRASKCLESPVSTSFAASLAPLSQARRARPAPAPALRHRLPELPPLPTAPPRAAAGIMIGLDGAWARGLNVAHGTRLVPRRYGSVRCLRSAEAHPPR